MGGLAGVAALELVLARTDWVAVGIPRVCGFPQGFEIELRVISGDGEELDSRLFHAHRAGHLRPDAQGLLPPEMLWLGVEFADGSRVSKVMPAVRDLEVAPEGVAPEGPVMWPQGGGGGAGDWRQSLWVWPLPPKGPVRFSCEWPALSISLVRHTIDGQLILAAAASAQVLSPTSTCRSHPGRATPNRAHRISRSSSDRPLALWVRAAASPVSRTRKAVNPKKRGSIVAAAGEHVQVGGARSQELRSPFAERSQLRPLFCTNNP